MKYFTRASQQMRLCALLCLGTATAQISSPLHTLPADDTTQQVATQHKRGLLARTAAFMRRLLGSKQVVHDEATQYLSVKNDLLDLIDMCDLDDDLFPHLKRFKIFVNGVYVPHETIDTKLVSVPHTPGRSCHISVVVPAATLLAILQNEEFSDYQGYVSDQIHDYVTSRPFVHWVSRTFGGQDRLISFLTNHAKAQVIFSYELDAQDLNRNGQLSMLTVIASKKYEWQETTPKITVRWRPLRTIELVFNDNKQ